MVQLCKGACLFLEDEYWTAACDNAFVHNLALLAAALYYQTQGLILTRVEGQSIRKEDISTIEVISLAFVESNGDMTTVAPAVRQNKPFPVQVVAA